MHSKTEKSKQKGVLEFASIKVGDVVWCKRYPNKELARGRITEIITESPDGPYFTFINEFDGSFRLSLYGDLIRKPTKAMMNKLISAKIRADKQVARLQEKKSKKKK